MFNRQLKANIEELDKQIGTWSGMLAQTDKPEEYEIILKKIEDLTKVRGQLTEAKVKDSHTGAIISGAFGIGGTLLVLHYEKVEVVTSKIFGPAIQQLFRKS